ncbi:hypothetical protein [Luteolibacter pohnpeiensis]|uniref:hypothetical protein n=1 Tax=Luteolibacter pohnpeiensis TaxID=454153 RepID=UPI0019083805|nr:hypothetical protein [Luteolibacter pohnpeiensis]
MTSCTAVSQQKEHVIVTGGPTLRKWENLRVKDDQHDRFWGNFVRASTIRIDELRTAYGNDVKVVWIVYKPSYVTRGQEDSQPYTTWIANLAKKRNTSLIWVNSSGDLIRAINSRPRGAVETFDYFGHSNRYAFLLDYGNEIMAASTQVLHENDLSRIKSSVFSKNAYCKSWGCHTGESMSAVWKKSVGMPMEGAKGPTSYLSITDNKLPTVSGSWVR